MIRSLLDGGMSLQKVRRAYAHLRRRGQLDEQLSGVKLVTDGRSVFEISADEKRVADLLREGQLAFSLAMDRVAENVNGRIAEHIYDRRNFVSALRRIESELEAQLPPASRRRVRATR